MNRYGLTVKEQRWLWLLQPVENLPVDLGAPCLLQTIC
jgi:hypothetical protein